MINQENMKLIMLNLYVENNMHWDNTYIAIQEKHKPIYVRNYLSDDVHTLIDEDYPELFRKLFQPPLVFSARGNTQLIPTTRDKHIIGIDLWENDIANVWDTHISKLKPTTIALIGQDGDKSKVKFLLDKGVNVIHLTPYVNDCKEFESNEKYLKLSTCLFKFEDVTMSMVKNIRREDVRLMFGMCSTIIEDGTSRHMKSLYRTMKNEFHEYNEEMHTKVKHLTTSQRN